nr:hypothetical protein JVH1_3766 [Rhodococcus sp. JVH1]
MSPVPRAAADHHGRATPVTIRTAERHGFRRSRYAWARVLIVSVRSVTVAVPFS